MSCKVVGCSAGRFLWVLPEPQAAVRGSEAETKAPAPAGGRKKAIHYSAAITGSLCESLQPAAIRMCCGSA